MNNTSLNQDIVPNPEGNNSNVYSANENQMYMPAAMPNLMGANAGNYPEIYYKLQPHIMMMCDQMDAYGMLPTKETIENAANQLHDNVLKNNPEIAEYAKNNDKKTPDLMPEARPAILSDYGYGGQYGSGYGRGYGYDSGYGSGGGFRPRGALRDIIDILLLSEFYRRRRRPYY